MPGPERQSVSQEINGERTLREKLHEAAVRSNKTLNAYIDNANSVLGEEIDPNLLKDFIQSSKATTRFVWESGFGIVYLGAMSLAITTHLLAKISVEEHK